MIGALKIFHLKNFLFPRRDRRIYLPCGVYSAADAVAAVHDACG